MFSKRPYHSALKSVAKTDIEDLPELNWFEADGCVAFTHDLRLGPHEDFSMADALYSEPSWRRGYALFLRRAGREPGNEASEYAAYLQGLKQTIQRLDVPAYVVMGRQMTALLSPPMIRPISLHGYKAWLGVWRADPTQGATVPEIVREVAERHEIVCDPSCGFGNLAFAMRLAGKRFVCSDINGRCIAYIAKELMGWDG